MPAVLIAIKEELEVAIARSPKLAALILVALGLTYGDVVGMIETLELIADAMEEAPGV